MSTVRLGNCGCYGGTGSRTVQFWRNISHVDDYHSPPGAPILPYPRVTSPGNDMCPACSGDITCDPAGVGTPKCNEWPTGERSTCVTNDSTHQRVGSNCFFKETSPATVSIPAPPIVGFKNVQARKMWHGRFSYLSHDYGAAGTTGPLSVTRDMDPSQGCGSLNIEYEQPTPSGTKYLRQGMTVSKIVTGDDPNGNCELNYTTTVDRYSGCANGSRTFTNNTSGADFTSDLEALVSFGQHLKDIHSIGYGYHFSSYSGGAGLAELYNTYPFDFTYSGSSCMITYYQDFYTTTKAVMATLTFDTIAGTLELYQYGSDLSSPVPNLVQQMHETIAFTATGFSRTKVGDQYTLGGGSRVLHTHTVTSWTGALSLPYSASDLYADIRALLAAWDLSDDAVYPWRTDDFTCIAPLVTYNEKGPTAPEGMTADPDPDASTYDGSVRGAPMTAGYGPYFDWDHETWKVCKNDTLQCFYLWEHGAFGKAYVEDAVSYPDAGDSTDRLMPWTATQWTQNYAGTAVRSPKAGNLPAGGFVLHSNGVCVAQKWAEQLVPRPGINWFRPCESDRYLPVWSTVRCVASSNGGSPEMLTLASDTTLETGDQAWVADASNVKVYTVTRGANYHTYTLTTLVATFDVSSFVSSGWVQFGSVGYRPNGVRMCGKLRFPNAWAIGGEVGIASATQSGPNVDLVLSTAAPYLRVGDSLDFTGVAGLGTNVVVGTVTDSTHITVPGTLSGTYTSGGKAKSHGAPAASWYSSASRRQFVYAEWGCSFRDWQERERVIDQYAACACSDAAPGDSSHIRQYQASYGMPREVASFTATQGQLGAPSGCAPFSILAVVPTSAPGVPAVEHFSGAVDVRSMPGSFAADDRYGAAWQGAHVQHIVDPLWEEPHQPCAIDSGSGLGINSPCGWKEDNGTCDADTCDGSTGDFYYPHRPYVENVLAAPAGAPALPAGIYLGYLSLLDLNVPIEPSGNVLPPPAPPGYVWAAGDMLATPNQVETAWGLWLSEQTCVCASGRWHAQYQANGVSC